MARRSRELSSLHKLRDSILGTGGLTNEFSNQFAIVPLILESPKSHRERACFTNGLRRSGRRGAAGTADVTLYTSAGKQCSGLIHSRKTTPETYSMNSATWTTVAHGFVVMFVLQRQDQYLHPERNRNQKLDEDQNQERNQNRDYI
ncbi:hypothetical protein EVAR_46234_1 [Eumeta japonica]|uniref:Uncharacterized protein n=1 Tax=Eumeta variegata TaxID=151549 RepID=A0A4C1XMV7_EUMVA|nr:hypothetical protein EVAR_46234_1 [Eumeta japonica]